MVRKEALRSLVRHGARGSQEALKKLLQEVCCDVLPGEPEKLGLGF
jgi:hypothetical protein